MALMVSSRLIPGVAFPVSIIEMSFVVCTVRVFSYALYTDVVV